MSGVTKHIYEHEIRDILQMWQKQIKTDKNLIAFIAAILQRK